MITPEQYEEAKRITDQYEIENYTPSPVEKEIIELMSLGLSMRETAETMLHPECTVETYRMRLFKKIGVKNGPQCIAWAFRAGILK